MSSREHFDNQPEHFDKQNIATIAEEKMQSAKPAKSNKSQLVKRALSSHSWVGLSVSALMYLVCLSGALVVFYEEFERWEQPVIEEYDDYSTRQIHMAIERFNQRVESTPESIYVVLPTESVPRMHISGDDQEWFINQDGSLSEPPIEGWTHFLKELHINLHLPQTFGIILVGALGAMLCGLIVTGILAHPRIFKDAFIWRPKGSRRIAQVDLHNRLSVWGTPFFFMIGLTGAFIGLVGILILVSASAFYNNDREAVIDEVYGADIEVTQSIEQLNIENALQQLQMTHPNAKPIYMVVQNFATENQFLEIAATLPERLIYSEIYRFRSNGELINHQGMSDGHWGQQLAYSVYRLHFGHFAGMPVKWVYFILGLALTIVCATGVNIWLARRKFTSFINDLWVAVVWGSPLAIVLASMSVMTRLSATMIFLLSTVMCIIYALWKKNPPRVKSHLQLLTALVLLVIPVWHHLHFSMSWNWNLVNAINFSLVIGSAIYIWLGLSVNRKPS